MGYAFTVKNSFKTNPIYYNPVAQDYFNRISAAGGSVINKNVINDFVDGISSIISPNLWVCWPLISSQNVGSGTTAYSLGSYNNSSLILNNGPVWLSNGISTNVGASNQYLETMLPDNRVGSVFHVVAGNAGNSGLQTSILLYCNSGNRANGQLLRLGGRSDTGSYEMFTVPGASFDIGGNQLSTNFIGLCGTRGLTPYKGGNNGSFINSNTTTQIVNSITRYRIGLRDDGAIPFTGIHAFSFFTLIDLTAAQFASIYSIYKQTLGSNLGLT